MRLLFDENLSWRLVTLLSDIYPASVHVRDLGLRGAEDEVIWSYARDNGYCIASKDNDFRQVSFLRGTPPKVLCLAVGNASTSVIAQLLRRQHARLIEFEADDEASLLVISANLV